MRLFFLLQSAPTSTITTTINFKCLLRTRYLSGHSTYILWFNLCHLFHYPDKKPTPQCCCVACWRSKKAVAELGFEARAVWLTLRSCSGSTGLWEPVGFLGGWKLRAEQGAHIELVLLFLGWIYAFGDAIFASTTKKISMSVNSFLRLIGG